MDWKKIAPWNWFTDEESRTAVTRTRARSEVFAEPFTTPRAELERIFDASFRHALAGIGSERAVSGRIPTLLRPSVDISEGKKAYTVRAELPGVELEDISLEVEDHTLVIRAEKRQESEEEDEGYHCVERSYGAAERVLSLPDDADSEAIEAKFKNGVLKLRIPKHPARAAHAR